MLSSAFENEMEKVTETETEIGIETVNATETETEKGIEKGTGIGTGTETEIETGTEAEIKTGTCLGIHHENPLLLEPDRIFKLVGPRLSRREHGRLRESNEG